MLELILKAVVTGFILSILIGPVFFILLETSIRKGVRAALAFDLGVFLSDLIYIFIAYIFYAEVARLTEGADSYIFKIIGGAVFVVFGVVNLAKKQKPKADSFQEEGPQTKDLVLLGLKGFLLNFANPAVIIYWFAVIGLGSDKGNAAGPGNNIFIYIAVLLITFFSIDLLKILGAKKLRPFITDNILLGLNRLTGIIILVTGLILVFKGINGFV